MSTTSLYHTKRDQIARSVDMDIEATLNMASKWLYVRKEYARQYFQNEGHEPLHNECEHAIDYCNEQIEKLLGL